MGKIKSSVAVAAGAIREALGSEDFIIVELVGGNPRPVYDAGGQLLKFTTGEEAAREAKRLTTADHKFQPRRVKDDKWTDRERARFGDKSYKELPWAQHVWWNNHRNIHGLHFPHVSVKNSVGLMAFTEDDNKGSADIQTPIKPGKYLERFFADILDPYIIRDLCTQFSNVFEDNCLIFADSEDDFEKLYVEGPSSCMSHSLAKYASPIHPVRVYAAGDLQLAYMKRDGRVVARTLVYPEKKLFSRVYGDAGRIEPLLKKEGYHRGPPSGAKLQRVIAYENKKDKSGNTAFVCPHIDDISWIWDRGDHLVVGEQGEKPRDAITHSGANGITEWVSLQCHCCKEQAGREGFKAAMADEEGGRSVRICAKCAADTSKAIVCGYDKKTLILRKFVVEMADGTFWWKRRFNDSGFTCAGNGKNYPNQQRITLLDGTVRRWPKYYSKEYVDQLATMTTCKNCGFKVVRECDKACSTKYAEDIKEHDRLYKAQTTQSYASGTATTIDWSSCSVTGRWSAGGNR